jgi:hypothetical protein
MISNFAAAPGYAVMHALPVTVARWGVTASRGLPLRPEAAAEAPQPR